MHRSSSWLWLAYPFAVALAISMAGCAQSQAQSASSPSASSPSASPPGLADTGKPVSTPLAHSESGAGVQIPSNIPREQWAKWMLEHARSQRAAAMTAETQANLPITLSAVAEMEAKGDYSQVIEASKHLSQQMPLNARVYYLAGRAYYFQWQFDAAQAQWKRAMALDATLGAQIGPLQSQMMRVRSAYPNLHLKPVVLVPSEVKAQQNAAIDRALELFDGHRFAELDAVFEGLQRTGVVSSDGYSAVFVVGNSLANPHYKYVFGPAAEQKQAREKAWAQMFRILEEWRRAQPPSKWAQLILFRAWNNRAWDLRGGDYANKVSPQQWQGVQQTLEQAAKIGTALPDSAKETSLFWETTLSFSLLAGLPREELETLYAQAAKQRLKDRTIDFEMTTILLPRWLGQSGEWQRWIAKRADEIGGEAGDIAYAQMILDASDFFEEEQFWKQPGLSWPRAKRGFEALLRRYPNSVSLATWLLVNADLNHDRATAKAMVMRLDNRANSNRWNYPRDFAHLRLRVLDPASK